MLKRLTRFFALFALVTRLKLDDEEEPTPAELASLDTSLGDALRPDGSVDTARLKAISQPVDIDAWRREVAGDKSQVAAER
jgi:hypothetical protein